MLLHRKNDSRDASSRSLTRYVEPAGTPAGSDFDPEQELRADEQPPERQLDAGLEVRVARPSL